MWKKNTRSKRFPISTVNVHTNMFNVLKLVQSSEDANCKSLTL